jgi:hypothetical protein
MGKPLRSPGGTHPRTPPQILSMPKAFEAELKDMQDTNYRCELPVTLHVTLFKVVFVKDNDVPLGDWISTAESVLRPHNVILDIKPDTKKPITLSYNGGPLLTQSDVADIRQEAHVTWQDSGAPPRLPIIICNFSAALRRGTAGMTLINQENPPDGRKELENGVTWLPFVLLPSGDPVADNATLVHEIAHACMLEHKSCGGDNLNILNDDGSLDRKTFQRRRINKFQIRKMAKAYFAMPKCLIR